MSRSAARRADGSRRFDPECNTTVDSKDAHECFVCRKPTVPGKVGHRIWSNLYAHVECAAKDPQGWHVETTAGCWDCRKSFPVREMVVQASTEDLDANRQIRRCRPCVAKLPPECSICRRHHGLEVTHACE